MAIDCLEAIYVTRVEGQDFAAEIQRPSAGKTWLGRGRSYESEAFLSLNTLLVGRFEAFKRALDM